MEDKFRSTIKIRRKYDNSKPGLDLVVGCFLVPVQLGLGESIGKFLNNAIVICLVAGLKRSGEAKERSGIVPGHGGYRLVADQVL